MNVLPPEKTTADQASFEGLISAMKIAIIGFGKIAHDEHAPAIAESGTFSLVAAVSRGKGPAGLPCFQDVETLLHSGPDFDAVSICLPPQVRFDAAAAALSAGKHVLLEKPPGATLGEVAQLGRLAEANNVSLYTSWHSRHAPGVEKARIWLSGRTVQRFHLSWCEDVRIWHPDQQWIWQPGGMSVFDTGMNGLALAEAVLPQSFALKSARLDIPENRFAPIAAGLDFTCTDGTGLRADFNWSHSGADHKALIAETAEGMLILDKGGERLVINGQCLIDEPQREYAAIYNRFSHLIAAGESDIDTTPLAHVADAFMIGERKTVEAFED